MEPLHVPFFRIDSEEQVYAVFLPGFRSDEIESMQYEFDAGDEVLRVYCRYQTGTESKPRTEVYPLAITDLNRQAFERMDKLAVFNPEEYPPEELTDDPEDQQRIRDFFEQLEALSARQPLDGEGPS